MNMRVHAQLLSPGVQHGEHGNSGADGTRIAGEFDDRRGAGLHQRRIAVALIGPQHLAQPSGVTVMWKYGTGSISACRRSSHSWVCVVWHLGQLRLPQEW